MATGNKTRMTTHEVGNFPIDLQLLSKMHSDKILMVINLCTILISVIAVTIVRRHQKIPNLRKKIFEEVASCTFVKHHSNM